MNIDENDLRALLDIATNSMDFGSGFLDNAEVEAIRRVGVLLGLNPITVTPSNFLKSYAHDYVPGTVSKSDWNPHSDPRETKRWTEPACSICHLPDTDRVHHGASVTEPR